MIVHGQQISRGTVQEFRIEVLKLCLGLAFVLAVELLLEFSGFHLEVQMCRS